MSQEINHDNRVTLFTHQYQEHFYAAEYHIEEQEIAIGHMDGPYVWSGWLIGRPNVPLIEHVFIKTGPKNAQTLADRIQGEIKKTPGTGIKKLLEEGWNYHCHKKCNEPSFTKYLNKVKENLQKNRGSLEVQAEQ